MADARASETDGRRRPDYSTQNETNISLGSIEQGSSDIQ